MSSPTLPDRGRNRKFQFPLWAAPVVLTAINVVALLLCVLGSPWEPLLAGLLITVLSVIPFGALGYLTWRIYHYSNQLQEELRVERERAEMMRQPQNVEHLRGELRRARPRIERVARPSGLGEFNDDQPPAPIAPPAGTGIFAAMKTFMTRRFVAGEELRLDSLRAHLDNHALDRVEPLQRDHELAFRIGLAGTVLGLGMQIFLATKFSQSSLLSETFMTGVVLKAGSTFVGILVASYARSRRWRILEEYDRLIARLEEFASTCFAPVFAELRAQSGDLAEALRGVIKELERTVARFERDLETALTRAVESASATLARNLHLTFSAELGGFIRTEVLDPFRVEVDRLKIAISRSGDGIAEGVRALRDGAQDFKKEISNTVNASSVISQRLEGAGFLTRELTARFEEIVARAESVAQTLGAWQGEAALAIEESRGQSRGQSRAQSHIGDADHYGDNQVMLEIAELLRRGNHDRDRFYAVLAQVLDGAAAPRKPRGKSEVINEHR